MKQPLNVAITGAAGQIGYALAFRVASGAMLGADQPVNLHLLEITPALPGLAGVVMELHDCAFGTLNRIVATDDARVAFRDCHVALLVGARPRSAGMERKDLLLANAQIFSAQGKALNDVAERSLRALGTDHVDIYFLHEPTLDALGGGDELVRTLEQLRQQGKTRCIGLAGAVLDCIDIARRYPPLAQIIQIGAAPGERAAQMLAAAALPCHFSFGHFRDKNAPMNALLASAVQHFPEGVLLYSSRRKTRWAEMVAQLSEVEPR